MSDPTEEIIRRADRPRNPTADEVDRIWARVTSEPARCVGEEVELIDAGAKVRAERHLPRLAVLVGAAAASLVAIALVVTERGSGVVANGVAGDGMAVSVEAAQTPQSVLAVCRDSVADLVEGIEAWDTVSDWAASGDGEPDVGRLTIAALREVAELDPEANEVLSEVEATLADRLARGSMLGDDRNLHEDAAKRGIAQIETSITRLDVGEQCSLDELAAALEE